MARRTSETLGTRIRRLRQERGLTQEQLAGPQLTESFISMVENSKRQPSRDALEHIAKQLGTEVDHLLSGRPVGLQVDLEIALQQARRAVDRGEVVAALETVKEVLAHTTPDEFPRTHARAHEVRGLIAERTEGASQAVEHFETALRIWDDQPLHLRAETVAGVARCTRRLETPQMAVHILSDYRHALEQAGADPSALMRTLTAMIYPYYAAGLPEKAAEVAREALALEARVDDPEHLACMHMAVARSLAQQGHYGDALHSLRRAEEVCLAGGWRNRVAKVQINEAIVLAKKEDYDSAREKLQDALDILSESPNRLDEALALNELAYVTRHLGDTTQAIAYLDQAQPLLEDGEVIELAFNERERGLCLTARDPATAEAHLQRAVDLYRIEGASQELATTFKALADVYVVQGDTGRAMQALRDGISAVEERSA
jgi:tetratricopeptide (TPR) repeat protein